MKIETYQKWASTQNNITFETIRSWAMGKIKESGLSATQLESFSKGFSKLVGGENKEIYDWATGYLQGLEYYKIEEKLSEMIHEKKKPPKAIYLGKEEIDVLKSWHPSLDSKKTRNFSFREIPVYKVTAKNHIGVGR